MGRELRVSTHDEIRGVEEVEIKKKMREGMMVANINDVDDLSVVSWFLHSSSP